MRDRITWIGLAVVLVFGVGCRGGEQPEPEAGSSAVVGPGAEDPDRLPKSKPNAAFNELIEADAEWVEEHREEIYRQARAAIAEPDYEATIGLAMMAPPGEAIELFERAASLRPDAALPHFYLALTFQEGWDGHLDVGKDGLDLARAAKELRRAAELEPDNALYPLFLMANHHLSGDHQAANAALLQVPELGEYRYDGWWPLHAQGYTLRMVGTYDAEVARKLGETGGIPMFMHMTKTVKAAIPDVKDGPTELDTATIEQRAEAAAHLGRMLTGGSSAIERAIGCAILKITGVRLERLYEERGMEDRIPTAQAWIEEAKEQRAAVNESLASGKESWWYREILRLDTELAAGTIDQTGYDEARSPLDEQLTRYFIPE